MEKTSFVFTGDIGFDKYMDGRWADGDLLAPSVSAFLNDADHRVINVEGPLYEVEKKDSEGAASLIHSMNPKVADFFESINADVWNICNNHIMDAKEQGIESTVRIAKEKKAKTLGAGMNILEASSPVLFPEAGGIGLIGVGYQRACRKAGEDTPGCFSWSDLELIQKRIDEVKKTSRWCVIVAHAGEEFTSLPSPYTRERYLKYLEMGADIVVAHHPHVPMNYEMVGNKAIFYSLGNFIFDTDYQRSQFNTEKGILLRIDFTEDSFSFTPFGLLIDRVKEQVTNGPVPDIFENVTKEEYEKLKALSAKAFIEATKKQLKYLKPSEFINATEEDFKKDFYTELRSGRVPGECLDMQIIYPLSLEASKEEWKDSNLTKVKEYILNQI